MTRSAPGVGICLILILFFANRSFGQYGGGIGDGFSVNNFVQLDNVLLNIYGGGISNSSTVSCFAQPDNVLYNIYGGGNQDGSAVNCFAQADNVLYNIYGGGTDDGSSVSCFAQADNVLYNIYGGGIEDGSSVNCFAQPDNVLYNIYNGGIEDGASVNCFAQPDNVLYSIYNGGNEDGFSVNCFVQPDNVLYNIYNGGAGDGFSKFCLGTLSEVPLPVELINFEGKFENDEVLLQWKTASEVNNDYFILERSTTNQEFKAIDKVEGAGTTSQSHNYSVIDQTAAKGINYYRLKQVDFDDRSTYSSVISVNVDRGSALAISIFPNPSDNSEIVRILATGIENTPVVLTITDVHGQLVNSFSATTDYQGQIVMPNSLSAGLAHGVYLVSVKFSDGQLIGKWVIK